MYFLLRLHVALSICFLSLATLSTGQTKQPSQAAGTPLTSQIVWRSETEGCLPHAARIINDDIFIGTCTRFLHRVDKQTGKKIWSFAIPDSLLTASHGTPCVSDSLVFIGTDAGWENRSAGALYAVSREDGTLRWRSDLGAGICGDVVMTKNTLYAITLDDRLVAVSKLTGKVLWYKQSNWIYYNNAHSPLISSPLAMDSIIYFPGRDSAIYALRAKDGSEIWKCRIGNEPLLRLTKAGSQLLTGTVDSVLKMIDIKSGTITATHKCNRRPVKLPLVTDSAIYLYYGDVSNEPREVVALTRDLKSEKWRSFTTNLKDSPYFCSNQLARINGTILAGTYDGKILAFDEQSGKNIWELTMDGPITLVQTVDSLVLTGNLAGQLMLQRPLAAPPKE